MPPILKIDCQLVAWDSEQDGVRHHLEDLPSPVDSFYEDHLLAAEFFLITVNGDPAALTAVHNQELLVYFTVRPPFRRWAQALFQYAKRLRSVNSAFVPTCDELYLSHAYEAARRVDLQAYFFKSEGISHQDMPQDHGFAIAVATAADKAMILADTKDFFDAVDGHLAAGQIYVGTYEGKVVSYGIIETGRILKSVASIGMIVKEDVRRRGYGGMTLRALKRHCLNRGIQPIAGCWYYNHQSKRTIESAGLYSQTRLLKIHF